MKVLVYGAGVLGSIHAVRLHEAGHDVTLVARGQRLRDLREHGILIAEGDHGEPRAVPLPAVENPTGTWDLIMVFVRSHQVAAVLDSLATVEGDVLFLLNWAAGPEPLAAALGADRILLGFGAQGGTMDGEVVRFRPESALTRLVSMPIGEPDGRVTPRLERVLAILRSAGFRAKGEPQMDAWLRTHAAFEVPLGLAVHAAGGPEALAGDRPGILRMVREMRRNLGAMPNPAVPRAFGLLRVLPEAVLVRVFRSFLRSNAAGPLRTDSPAVAGELALLAEQLQAEQLRAKPPRTAEQGRTEQ